VKLLDRQAVHHVLRGQSPVLQELYHRSCVCLVHRDDMLLLDRPGVSIVLLGASLQLLVHQAVPHVQREHPLM
jgi:hypothetical protein